MKNRIRILKGRYNKIRITDCVFPLLKPVDITNGKITAVVDARELLGSDYSVICVDVEDYKILQ